MTEAERVRALTEKARVLYEGKRTAHRSCGIAIAEAFGRRTQAYQALRGGGLTGEGTCGAVLGGLLVLGELLGDPDPTGAATPALKAAAETYRTEIERRIRAGRAGARTCRDLTGPFPVFQSEERAGFCTALVATVAQLVAEIAAAHGVRVEPSPIPGV